MPHPAHLALPQQFWWLVIPETCPPGEGTVLQIGQDLLGDQAGLLISTPRTTFVRATFSPAAGATTFGIISSRQYQW